MKRFSVFALLMAVAVVFTYGLAFAGPAASARQANSACGCADCKCPDCNGEFCTCDVCECGSCGCREAAAASSVTIYRSVAEAQVKPAAAECVCKCPDCNGEVCTCDVCECVGRACAE